MHDRVKKAFDFASESVKQLLTLSTAILTLTITFGKDVFQSVSAEAKENLTYAWIIYLVSIFFGIMTLLALTGTLEPAKKKGSSGSSGGGAGGGGGGNSAEVESGPQPSIRGGSVTFFSVLQILTFLAATALVIKSGVAAFKSVGSTGGTEDNLGQQVRDMQRGLTDAMMRRDVAWIDQNLANDCVIMASLGQVMNKGQAVGDIKSGDLSYESIAVDDVSTQVYGDTVIEIGHAIVKGKYKEQDISGQYRYSAVYTRRQGKWQGISFQFARVDQPSPQSGKRSSTRGGSRRHSHPRRR
jgi:ketosteroid isomerase-like protein